MPNSEYDNQVTESIRSVFQLATKIEEQLTILTEGQKELAVKLEKQIDLHNDLNTRVVVLESKNVELMHTKIQELENKVTTLTDKINTEKDWWDRWKVYLINAIWVIVMSIIIWKLGLHAPEVAP